MTRNSIIGAGLGLLLALVAAGPASAATTDCEGAQDAFDDSAPGGTVTLTEDCAFGQTLELPGHQITFEGSSPDITLDGEEEYRILQGTNVGTTVIRNLTFVNGRAEGFFNPEGPSDSGNGGAISVFGNSPITVENARFFNNAAEQAGGAIFALAFSQEPVTLRGNTFGSSAAGTANTASEGGAVAVNSVVLDAIANTFTGNFTRFFRSEGDELAGDGGGLWAFTNDLRLDGNTFRANRSGFQGGGAAATVCGDSDVTGNVFEDNAIESTSDLRGSSARQTFFDAAGGGLYVELSCPQLELRRGVAPDPEDFGLNQSGNRFDGNSVSSRYFDVSGGGELVSGYSVLSTNDRFHDNSVATTECCEDAEGGGLSAVLDDAEDRVVARNLVATGNRVTGNAEGESEGGGVYVGSEGGGVLTLTNATIAANSADDGSGIAGDDRDALELHNSIVYGNVTGDEEGSEISGFLEDQGALNIAPGEGRDIRFTDACETPGTPYTGEGNVCVDPKLTAAAAGDVHQTAASPTLDVASDALLDGLATDWEGDARRLDGDGDGTARVDMGADEYVRPAPVTPPPPPPPPPAAQGAVLGTSAKSCVSRRAFRIRLRNRGQKVVRATVFVNGKRVRVLRGARLTSFVNLRGLPKGRFSVRIELKLANGKTLKGTRRYRTCTPPRPHGVPRV